MKLATWSWIVVAGCVPARTAELACEVNADCADDRVCASGFCVVPEVDAGAGAEPDAPPDAQPAACELFESRHFAACDLPAPGAIVFDVAGTWTYDTATKSLVDPNGESQVPPNHDVESGVVLSLDQLAIPAGVTLRTVGAKPLIIASWSTITIAGTLDVGSARAAAPAAGANHAGCAVAAGGLANAAGGGGGGGGGFAAPGATGGSGPVGGGGAGGAALARPLLAGGCAGGRGGNGDTANGGEPGAGGGAIQLTARESITIDGVVTAHGAGGSAARNDSGGGGGGAGGMIGLEAPSIAVRGAGVLAANGGGGSGGASGNTTSQPGADGTRTAARALGGAAGGGGGPGGAGAAGAVLSPIAGAASGAGGGGGGGGGAGVIIFAGTVSPAIDASATVSPPFGVP